MKNKEGKRRMVPVYFKQDRYDRLKGLADAQDRSCSMSSLVGEIVCGIYLKMLDNGEIPKYTSEFDQLEFILDNASKDDILAVREFLANLEGQIRETHG